MLESSSTRRVRRSVVSDAIGSLLDRMRAEIRADIALVIEADPANANRACVLASKANDCAAAFMPSEPIELMGLLPSTLAALPELHLRSTIRLHRLSCLSTLVIPWRARQTRGWLVVGSIDPADTIKVAKRKAHQYGRMLRQTYVESSMLSCSAIATEMAQATRTLAEAEQSEHSLDDLLDHALLVGKGFLKTSAFYISLPNQSADVFTFSRHLGVRTSAFKQLRMGAGQGLGGLARAERRVIRSLNYAEDFRERDAPVNETVREGFLSAMCTPLIVDGRIGGLLYAANRHLTAFSETDANMLEDFAGNVSLLFRRTELEKVRQSAVRQHERDRLARDLHDTVVRKLMDIGYQSRIAREGEGGSSVFSHLSAIEEAAEACLTIIRKSIANLSSEWEGMEQPSIRDIIHVLKITSRPRRLEHVFDVHNETGSDLLPFSVASGMLRICREALHNAEMHSGGTRVLVQITVTKASAHLIIEDDGNGIDEGDLPQMLNRNEHLGLRQMRFIASENGGTCTLAGAAGGGLCLKVTMPLF